MRAIIYCRVSTDAQEAQGTSLDSQAEACKRYCLSKGYTIYKVVKEVYSGLSIDRPLLSELRNEALKGYFDVVVGYALDRLSRDPVHFVVLQDALEKDHVRIECVTESIESSDFGKMITYIRGVCAKQEALKIKERTMRGKLTRVKSGKLPFGAALYGYTYNKQTCKREIHPEQAEIVRLIFKLLAEDKMSSRSIVKYLNSQNIPSPRGCKWLWSGVRSMVNNESYYGVTYAYKYKTVTTNGKTHHTLTDPSDRIALTDVSPAIVTKELFDKANNQLKVNFSEGNYTKLYEYLLKGFIYCGKCGGAFVGLYQKNSNHKFYRCHRRKDKRCDNRSISARKIEPLVKEKILSIIANNNHIKSFVQTNVDSGETESSIKSNLVSKQGQLVKLNQQRERVMRMYVDLQLLPEHEAIKKLKALDDERTGIEAELSQLKVKLEDIEKLKLYQLAIEYQCKELNEQINKGDSISLRAALQNLHIKIVITDEDIRIEGDLGSIAHVNKSSYSSVRVLCVPFSITVR